MKIEVFNGDYIIMNYKITLEYDGSRYNGWQRQGNTDNTIQGKLEEILGKYFNQEIEIHGSGRTDAGVHALGQVANFKIQKDFVPFDTSNLHDTTSLQRAINDFLPEDIRITSMSVVDNRFHARLNAKSKIYRYRLCLTNKRSVFNRKYCALVHDTSKNINIDAMRMAASSFIGEHDMACFSDTKTKKSTVRYVESITFSTEAVDNDLYLIVDFKGNGFLYHTVRLMMGTLIKIGLGECTPNLVEEIFASNNRKQVPYMAPAEGLFLVNVEY